MKILVNIVIFVCTTIIGFIFPEIVKEFISSAAFQLLLNVILALGLFAGVSTIDKQFIRSHLLDSSLVVTIGVLMKVGIVGSILCLIFNEWSPVMFALATTMGQVDPIGTAHSNRNEVIISDKARNIIQTWASFDDPLTILIGFVILAPLLVNGAGLSLLDYCLNVLLNVGIAAVLSITFLFYTRIKGLKRTAITTATLIIAGLSLVTGYFFGIWIGLMLGIALSAITVRQDSIDLLVKKIPWEHAMNLLLDFAFFASIAGAGFVIDLRLLADLHVWLVASILGIGVHVLHTCATWLLLGTGNRFKRNEIAFISRSQINGITSIILGLYFEQFIPGILTTVVVSVGCVAIIYYIRKRIKV